MKHIFRYLGVTLLLAGIISACSPEKITHPSEAGIPSATQIEPVISVDQEINQVTFALPAGTKGLIPVWLFQDKTGDWTQYSAQNGLKKIFTTAGDYSVRMHLMNSNGMSPDFVQKTFHIDNTIMGLLSAMEYLRDSDTPNKEAAKDKNREIHVRPKHEKTVLAYDSMGNEKQLKLLETSELVLLQYNDYNVELLYKALNDEYYKVIVSKYYFGIHFEEV